MADLIERHLIALQAAGRSTNTISDRRRLLHHADRQLPYGLNSADEEEIIAYLANPDWSAWTRRTYFNHLFGYYKHGTRRGWLTCNPMAELEPPAKGPAIPHPCSDAELAVALTAPAPYGTAMWLAAYAGLRACEIATAHTDDIADGQLRVTGKGGKVRMVPLAPILVDHLAGTVGPLCTTAAGATVTADQLSAHQRPVWQSLGLSTAVHLHAGRHWCATRLVEAGVEIDVIREWLGHASLATTQIYLKVSDRRRRAAATMLPHLAPPRAHRPVDARPVRAEDPLRRGASQAA